METLCDNSAKDVMLIWRLGQLVPISSHLLYVPLDGTVFPGLSAFEAQLLPDKKANNIAYLPIIPKSPTDPSVVEDKVIYLVKIAEALGDKWTTITGDQVTYELAMTIIDKFPDQLANVILHLEGFHLAHNYLKAICKIMQESGAEDLIVLAGLCKE